MILSARWLLEESGWRFTQPRKKRAFGQSSSWEDFGTSRETIQQMRWLSNERLSLYFQQPLLYRSPSGTAPNPREWARNPVTMSAGTAPGRRESRDEFIQDRCWVPIQEVTTIARGLFRAFWKDEAVVAKFLTEARSTINTCFYIMSGAHAYYLLDLILSTVCPVHLYGKKKLKAYISVSHHEVSPLNSYAARLIISPLRYRGFSI